MNLSHNILPLLQRLISISPYKMHFHHLQEVSTAPALPRSLSLRPLLRVTANPELWALVKLKKGVTSRCAVCLRPQHSEADGGGRPRMRRQRQTETEMRQRQLSNIQGHRIIIFTNISILKQQQGNRKESDQSKT